MRNLLYSGILALGLTSLSPLFAKEDQDYLAERLRRLKSFQQKEALLLTLNDHAVEALISNPPLQLDEIKNIPEATWAALIRRVPKQPVHPSILAALSDDLKVLMVFRTNPFLKMELKDSVSAADWKRLERLWNEHAQMIMANLGPLDGCSAVMKGLGIQD
jgi:hypothetical protein